MERFHQMFGENSDRVSYGYRDVTFANENFAIDELLVTDKLFQAADFSVRGRYVGLVESVKENGGKVRIFIVFKTIR